MDLSGFSSDGDARRTKTQKEKMTGAIVSSAAFGLDHEGFAMHGRRCGDGSITDIEGQDSKHVKKNFLGALAGVRHLQYGNMEAVWSHLQTGYSEFGAFEMGMDKAAIDRDDRQNFVAAVRASGLRASRQLKKLQDATLGDAHTAGST